MQVSRQETDFGVISTVQLAAADEVQQVLFLGGWKQNEKLMTFMQEVLAVDHGISSVGLGAFDTVAPTIEPDIDRAEDPVLADIPDRMLLRAKILNDLSRTVLCDNLSPSVVLTHCAGANVYLLSQYLQMAGGEGGALPRQGVLAEPMIREGEDLRAMTYIKLWKRHEDAASEDPTKISLAAMAPKGDTMDAKAGTRALGDIVKSRGTTLLGHVLTGSEVLQIVVGENDYASDREHLETGFAASGIQIAMHQYPEQPRTGHGYLLAEPHAATKFIAPLLI